MFRWVEHTAVLSPALPHPRSDSVSDVGDVLALSSPNRPEALYRGG